MVIIPLQTEKVEIRIRLVWHLHEFSLGPLDTWNIFIPPSNIRSFVCFFKCGNVLNFQELILVGYYFIIYKFLFQSTLKKKIHFH